jgi:hypothetical protein
MKLRGDKVEKAKVIELAKDLKLCDQRELVARVVISYSTTAKILNAAFTRNQRAGHDGFVGIHNEELVCFESNMFGTKPSREYFRIPFAEIKSHSMKKGFLGLSNIWLVQDDRKTHKFYVTKKRLDIIKQMDKLIA